jgi:hypothetical protein
MLNGAMDTSKRQQRSDERSRSDGAQLKVSLGRVMDRAKEPIEIFGLINSTSLKICDAGDSRQAIYIYMDLKNNHELYIFKHDARQSTR